MLTNTIVEYWFRKLSWKTIVIFTLVIFLSFFIRGASSKDPQNVVLQLLQNNASILINSINILIKNNRISYSNLQLQQLIDELVEQTGVYFIIVEVQKKVFFASNSTDIPFSLKHDEFYALLKASLKAGIQENVMKWDLVTLKNNEYLVIYTKVQNINSGSTINLAKDDFEDSSFIFIGLNPIPLLQIQQTGNKQVLSYSGTVLFFCLFLLVSVLFFKTFKKSRKIHNISTLIEHIVLTVKDGIILLDSNGSILQMNPAAAQFFHITSSIVSSWIYGNNRKNNEFFPPNFQELIKQFVEKKSLEATEVLLSLAGREYYIEVQGTYFSSAKRGQPEYFLFFRDITKIRLLEKELYQKDTLAAIGSLASGVAHELRNPLSSIKGYANYLSDRLSLDKSEQEILKIIMQEVDRLNRVISDLIGIAVPTDVYPEYIDLQKVIEDTLCLIELDAKTHFVELIFNKKEDLPFVPLDPDRIRQVLLNLCLNALDAMPNGGLLEVTFHLNKNTQQFFLEVIDTGIGIDKEILPQIFDPYFTTKPKGTGLGLSTVRKIVEAHKGIITVSSELGKGTIFRLVFPLNFNES